MGDQIRVVIEFRRKRQAMQRAGLLLLVHGEVTDPEVDIFDREAVFLDKVLAPLLRRHQGLKVVLEHITTREAVRFVSGTPPRVAATITAPPMSPTTHRVLAPETAIIDRANRARRKVLDECRAELNPNS